MHRGTIVNPMNFRRTKVDPLKVGELLLILQGIGELLSILCVLASMKLFERKLYLIQKSLEFGICNLKFGNLELKI